MKNENKSALNIIERILNGELSGAAADDALFHLISGTKGDVVPVKGGLPNANPTAGMSFDEVYTPHASGGDLYVARGFSRVYHITRDENGKITNMIEANNE